MTNNLIIQIEQEKTESEVKGYIANPFSTKDIKITNQVFVINLNILLL